jgi:hypothetical protein
MSSSITSSEPVRRPKPVRRPEPIRRYVLAAIGLAVAWLLATVAANVLVDPQAVFGLDLLRSHLNPNTRYAALRDYQAAPERYDAVLFGSSRGNAFDRALLAEQMGVRNVANFSVPFGLLTDHLPVLEYLLRDKAAHGGRLAAVFLLMDADFFGKQPWTNLNIDSFLPPELSGENPFRFWWRYLTAFQLRNWKNDLAASARLAADAGPPLPPVMRRTPMAAGLVPMRPLPPAGNALVPVALEELDAPEIRSDLAHQLDLLARFVTLCREADTRLYIALSPLNRQNVHDDQAPDNERIVDAIARVTPVWDFDRPAWLSERPDLWLDFSHYSPAVAALMMQRIFGRPATAPADFGRLRGP